MELFFIFLFGLAVGSFLNVLIDRLPQGKSIRGRSYCDHCHKKLNNLDLIPIFSYLLLAGRCRFCKQKISWQYPLVEFLTGLIFIFTWVFTPFDGILKLLYLALMACLIGIFFSDLKYQLIPDEIQVAALIFSALGFFLTGGIGLVVARLLDGLLIGLPLLAVFLLTKQKGMGFGDVKLGFIMGYLLGWSSGFIALYIAFITGALAGLMAIFLHKRKFKSKLPFGPFLVLGTVAMLIFGNLINNFMAKLFGF